MPKSTFVISNPNSLVFYMMFAGKFLVMDSLPHIHTNTLGVEHQDPALVLPSIRVRCQYFL